MDVAQPLTASQAFFALLDTALGVRVEEGTGTTAKPAAGAIKTASASQQLQATTSGKRHVQLTEPRRSTKGRPGNAPPPKQAADPRGWDSMVYKSADAAPKRFTAAQARAPTPGGARAPAVSDRARRMAEATDSAYAAIPRPPPTPLRLADLADEEVEGVHEDPEVDATRLGAHDARVQAAAARLAAARRPASAGTPKGPGSRLPTPPSPQRPPLPATVAPKTTAAVHDPMGWSPQAPILKRLHEVEHLRTGKAQHATKLEHDAFVRQLKARFGDQARRAYSIKRAHAHPLPADVAASSATALTGAAPPAPLHFSPAFLRSFFRGLDLVDMRIAVVDWSMRKFANLRQLSLVGNELAAVDAAHLPEQLEILSLQCNRWVARPLCADQRQRQSYC
jgi:hypothetical protein